MMITTQLLLAQAEGPGFGNMLLFIVPMFVIMYLLMIKPQQKKQKEHQEMLKKVKVGDNVVTSGGIHGTIAAVKQGTFVIKVAENTKFEISRSSVAAVKTEETEEGSEKK